MEEKNILSQLLKKYGTSVKSKKLMANELEVSLATLYRKLEVYDLLKYEKNFQFMRNDNISLLIPIISTK